MDFSRPRTSGSAAPRRIFTAPVAPVAAVSPQSTGGLVDTLYDHPNVKIISFTAGSRTLSVGPRTAAVPDIEPGSLSWSSQLERTIAVGPFRIYRAPGSVAFLSCGSALQPILPKSQVWCVDEGSSKFVLQIRRPQFWRIEVPVGEEEEVRRAQQLRDVFDAILQFEKTECPFKRTFTVELPERPQTPVKKRPWTPARRSSASLPLTPSTPVEIARLHEGTPRGSFCIADLRSALDARRALNEHARNLEPPTEEPVLIETEGDGLSARRRNEDSSSPSPGRKSSLAASPPQVPHINLPRSRTREAGPTAAPAEVPRFKSPSESLESFHGRESWLSAPLPPSPPLSTPGSPRSSSGQLQTPVAPETTDTHQGTHGHTVTSKPSQTWSVATADSHPESEYSATTAPSSVHDPDCSSPCAPLQPQQTTTIITRQSPTAATEPETPVKTAASSSSLSPSTRGRRPPIRRATTTSSSISPVRTLSPLPPAANLLTPPRRTSQPTTTTPRRNTTTVRTPGAAALAAVRRLPMTVLAKTCEILMSPPSHLISLMLNVAARIAAGEWRGLVFGTGEGGERVSVTWDWSEDEGCAEGSRDRQGCYTAGGREEGDGGAVGWGSGFAGGNANGDFWLRGRRARPGTGTGTGMGRRLKMAGAFPESDDDGDDDDEDEEEEEEEEEVGPVDQPAGVKGKSVSPGRRKGLEGDTTAAAAAVAVVEMTATGGNARYGGGEQSGQDSDAEWGVD